MTRFVGFGLSFVPLVCGKHLCQLRNNLNVDKGSIVGLTGSWSIRKNLQCSWSYIEGPCGGRGGGQMEEVR
jgi:hypothetical protein